MQNVCGIPLSASRNCSSARASLRPPAGPSSPSALSSQECSGPCAVPIRSSPSAVACLTVSSRTIGLTDQRRPDSLTSMSRTHVVVHLLTCGRLHVGYSTMLRFVILGAILASGLQAQPTFHKDVEPIMQAKCQQCQADESLQYKGQDGHPGYECFGRVGLQTLSAGSYSGSWVPGARVQRVDRAAVRTASKNPL